MSFLKGFCVGGWRVEPTLNQIIPIEDPENPVKLEPKAMEVLVYLAERASEVVDKESVIRDVWRGAFVTNEVLTNAVWELRRALGDDARSSVFIQTIPKRGYRLVAPVSGIEEVAGPPGARGPRAPRLGIAAVAVLSLLALTWLYRSRPAPDEPVTRFAIEPAEALAPFYLPAIALSQDARKIVYAGASSGLFLRSMDQIDSKPIPGTEAGHGPFFSPDGGSVAFFAGRALKRVDLDPGGPPVELARVGAPRGGAWGSDGWIYFSGGSNQGIRRVPAEGGEVESVTELDEALSEWTHRWPEVLPGAKAVLFTAASGEIESFDEANILALDLESGQKRVVIEGGSFPRYVSGRLFYARRKEIFAVDFDAETLSARGASRSVSKEVRLYPINGAAQMSFSRDGSIAFVPVSPGRESRHRLLWMDRKGERTTIVEDRRVLHDPAISPDGDKLALSIATEGNTDLWVYDVGRETLTRLTTSSGEEEHSIFTPDGREVTYDYSLSGPFRVFSRAADGASEARAITAESHNERPESYSRDGKTLVVSQEHSETGFDLWWIELEGEPQRRPLLVTPFDERSASLSPDGRFIAYSSNESGRFEVYVASFPEPGARFQVSVDGGEEPRWTRGGREILFLGTDGVSAAAIDASGKPLGEKPRMAFPWKAPLSFLEGAYRKHYDALPSGERILLIEGETDPASNRVHVALNWIREQD